MIKTDNIFSALAAFALDPNQFPRIDIISIVSRVGAGVAAPRGRGHDLRSIVLETTQQNATAFVWIGFFSVRADRVIVFTGEFQRAHFSVYKSSLKSSLRSRSARSNTCRRNRRES